MEVFSYEDVPMNEDCEVRVHPDLQRSTMAYSDNAGQFGWNLVKVSFIAEDLINNNYNGNRDGKGALSP